MTATQTTANRQIARAAGTVMAAFVLSNLTGLVRQVLVTRAFGTGLEIDAFSAPTLRDRRNPNSTAAVTATPAVAPPALPAVATALRVS